ncbi:MAG: hypothetical protein LBC64_09490 [Fibromonadaceae bacterium]|jgi:hypothetical protein|nr:hypothetical protein [Fibromonadaceae bacterium]
MRYAIVVLGLLCSMSFAQVSAALDSIEENVIGFAVNGHAKGGILSSSLSYDTSDVSEYSAFTDFLLNISVRPSNETKATFDLRFHKDWQSAYREGNNSPIVRWWSYDGNILDKKLKFNLGTMRLAYTPLTIYLPEPEFIMEPEIFVDLKREAMEERYLDGTNRRLLQGLNLEYQMSAGMFDKIFLQGTVVRLRKVADASDRISFDFDPSKDRFSTGARFGIETQGIYFGVNEVFTFNRFSSSFKNTLVDTADALDYEKNNVMSFELSYNSKQLLQGPVSFGVDAEYALSSWSWWQHKRDAAITESSLDFAAIPDEVPSVTSPGTNKPNYYPYYKITSTKPRYKLSMVEELTSNAALLARAFVSYDENPFEAKFSGTFLKTDKDFEAELAATPAYLPNLPILNSDADLAQNLEQFRSGSLENMYYSLYYTLPLNAISIVSGKQGLATNSLCIKGSNSSSISLYQAACLDNNYKLVQYYRNAYTQQTYTRLERSKFSLVDPSVNMALPNGYATPNRSGGDADLKFTWNKSVSFRGVFGTFSAEEGAKYTRVGSGLEVNVARLADLSIPLVVTGSYEQNKGENINLDSLNSLNVQTNRIMAGFKVGIWKGLSLIGGFQQLAKEFESPYVIVKDVFNVNKTSETLIIGGPQYKISERANFTLQGASLSNTVSYTESGVAKDIILDKLIMSGMVTVGF